MELCLFVYKIHQPLKWKTYYHVNITILAFRLHVKIYILISIPIAHRAVGIRFKTKCNNIVVPFIVSGSLYICTAMAQYIYYNMKNILLHIYSFCVCQKFCSNFIFIIKSKVLRFVNAYYTQAITTGIPIFQFVYISNQRN